MQPASPVKPEAFDCIVIGGGPAGLEAITYLARYRRKTLLIDNGKSRALLAPRIMNLAGYPRGISGKSLLERMRRQALRFGARFFAGEARVRRTRGGFLVTAGEFSFFAKFVILATGVRDRQPAGVDCAGLCRLRLLAYCPVCDGYEHAGRKIAVLVNGRNALSKARFIREISKDLHIVRLEGPPVSAADHKELRRLGARLYEGPLLELRAASGGGVLMKLGPGRLRADLVYVELGVHVPSAATEGIPEIRRAEQGRYHIQKHRQTSVRGLYAIGDCANSLSQITVAVGEAATAATHIHNRLIHLKVRPSSGGRR